MLPARYRFFGHRGTIVRCVPNLSRRETEVAQLVAEQLSNREIAERLFVSERTAEFHLEQIRNKLGFHNRQQIAAWVAAQGGREPPPNRLPPRLTSFVGRAADLKGVTDLLEKTRIVTITGTGGTGKTRLAIELAARAVSSYPDGAWFVDLQAVEDPRLLAAEVAAALFVTNVEQELAVKRRLIVLDNCEQLAEPCRDLIERVLLACSELRVLATSREPLHVPSEGVWSLGPLPPEEAVALFLDRAGLATPELSLADIDPAPVRAICQDLDGIPLAIELAASRARVMSLADIRARLSRRFRLLVDTGARSGRHRSLAATVAWSYDLLTEEERDVFRKLAIFAGGFLLDSAESVIGPEVASVLDRLVERSMVVAERVPDRQTRYRLLVNLREYARERLSESGDTASLRSVHAHRFRALADTASTQLEGPRQATWMRRIADELDEYRSAFVWALDTEPKSAVAIAAGLGWFWGMSGRISEGRRVLAAALEQVPDRSRERARVLIPLGWLTRLLGEFEVGTSFHSESVQILRELGDPIELAQALVWDAEAAANRGDWSMARRGWEEAIERLTPLGVSQPLAYANLEMSNVLLRERNAERAREDATRSLAMFTELGNARGVALSHLMLSQAAWLDHEFEGARRELLQCLNGLSAVTARADLIVPLKAAAALALDEGEARSGVALAAAAEALVQGMRVRTGGFMDWLEASLEPRLAKASSELGEAAYQDAWTLGLDLGADGAVDLVVSSFQH